ncbi:hypothetical protein BT69DRAFT_1288456, partial [Atractiella rhizophila]
MVDEREEEDDVDMDEIDMDSWKEGKPLQPEQIVARRIDVPFAEKRAYNSTPGKYRKRNKPGEGELHGEIR